MRSCHNLSAGFDDPNLVSCAGLIPVMTLAERAGLHDLARAHVRVPGAAGSNADVKVAALVAGMVAGADTIDAMDLLRHGGMGRVSTAGRAPSTLGTFLRSFTFGHVRQLDAVASRVLVNLAARAPLLAGADQVAFVDIDDTIKATYGYAKQGAGYGYSGVKGLNALLAIVSTPLSAPVIAATRLRRGPTNSAKGAARLVADALVTARKAGATGQVTVRADSAYYIHDVIAAARTGVARFSITARMDPAVTRAIAQIPDTAWVGIKYPHAIYDQEEQRWVSDAEVAEIGFTDLGDLGVGHPALFFLVVDRVRVLDAHPGVVGDLGDRPGHGGVHAGGDGEPGPTGARGGDHVVVVVRRVAANSDLSGRPGLGRGDQGDHPDPRRRLGGHQVPARDLRRGRTTLGVRRRGRRDRIHRVHLTPPLRAHRCPPDRAPRQAPEPQDGPGRAGRPVLRLAPPRGLPRLGRVDARRRGHPPRPRDRGEGHRRVEG